MSHCNSDFDTHLYTSLPLALDQSEEDQSVIGNVGMALTYAARFARVLVHISPSVSACSERSCTPTANVSEGWHVSVIARILSPSDLTVWLPRTTVCG